MCMSVSGRGKKGEEGGGGGGGAPKGAATQQWERKGGAQEEHLQVLLCGVLREVGDADRVLVALPPGVGACGAAAAAASLHVRGHVAAVPGKRTGGSGRVRSSAAGRLLEGSRQENTEAQGTGSRGTAEIQRVGNTQWRREL